MDRSVSAERSRLGRFTVWFVNQYSGSPRHGMEFRHYELGRELVQRGNTVVVISGTWSHLFTTPPVTRATYGRENLDGIDQWWVRVPRYVRSTSLARVWNMAVFAIRLVRFPMARVASPDVIVVSSPSPFPFLIAERWRRRTGARLVFEVRDLWPLTLVELGGMSARHPFALVLGWFERRAYRRADAVVSVLPGAEPYLRAHGMPADRLRVIPNGIADDALHSESTATPDPILEAIRGADLSVGFVGTLGAANAVDGLISAARLLRDEPIRFVIVGHGPEEARLRSEASGLGNVVFTGSVPKGDVAACLAAFDICWLGYHRSSLYRYGISPNKLFDYLAAGRPVVLSAEAANDIVTDAACGETVAPDDPAAIAAAILRLRDAGPERRAELGANGRAYVERNHAYSRLAADYQALFADLTARRLGRTPDPGAHGG